MELSRVGFAPACYSVRNVRPAAKTNKVAETAGSMGMLQGTKLPSYDLSFGMASSIIKNLSTKAKV